MNSVCKKEGCGGERYALGLCSAHYHEARRRKLGHKPRGEPKDGSLEAKAPRSMIERLNNLVPRGEQSVFIRKAVGSALRRLERQKERATASR